MMGLLDPTMAIAVPSRPHEGYELRSPGTSNVCEGPCGPRTMIRPPLSTAIREPSGDMAGFLDASGSSSVTRYCVKFASTTRYTSLLPRLKAEKTIERPSGD